MEEHSIIKEFLENMPNSILFYLSPEKFQKLGRGNFIEHLSSTYDISQLYRMIMTNPDIYDSELEDVAELYKEAMENMRAIEREKEFQNQMERSQKRVDKMVQEYEQDQEDYGKQYEKESKKVAEQWAKEYDQTILDYFVSPLERKMIKEYIAKLIPEQKKFIVDMVMNSKALIQMSDEERSKYVAKFIRSMARPGSKY